MNIDATFRPIDRWPAEITRERKRSRFDTAWDVTLELLKRELRHLRARDVVIQLALGERDIRLDGYPRSNARPDHPGAILAFDSRYGPLKYATDTFKDWRDNVRAIALGLEALRKVDRYGVTKRGVGWKALPAGNGADPDLVARGRQLIDLLGGVREALHATHPDHGGNPEDFHAVQTAR